jgi:hypothetical protein
MNKRALLDKVIEKLESDHKGLAAAALSTYQAATHEESGAEDQYDTRGLEASYLAGAQAKRVADLEQLILQYRHLDMVDFTGAAPIVATALVELKNEDGKRNFYFLLPKGGGMSIAHEGHNIQIITPQSPMGEALIGRKVGDVAVLDNGRETKELEVISVH